MIAPRPGLASRFKNTKRVGLLAKLGRGKYSPQLAAEVRPSEPRIERALYLRWVKAVFMLWTHKVLESIPRTDAREDAGPLLRAQWDQLVNESGLRGMLTRVARSLADKNKAYFDKVVKVPVPAIGKQADMVAQWTEENIRLISGMGADMVEDLNATLGESLRAGRRHEEIAKDLQDRIGVGESRAKLIARDQTLKYNAAIHQAQAEAAGITDFTWSTSHDGAVRPMHRALDGKRFRYDDPPVTNEDGDRNLPGEDYQCRCVAIPVIELFDDLDEAPVDNPGALGAADDET